MMLWMMSKRKAIHQILRMRFLGGSRETLDIFICSIVIYVTSTMGSCGWTFRINIESFWFERRWWYNKHNNSWCICTICNLTPSYRQKGGNNSSHYPSQLNSHKNLRLKHKLYLLFRERGVIDREMLDYGLILLERDVNCLLRTRNVCRFVQSGMYWQGWTSYWCMSLKVTIHRLGMQLESKK